METYKGTQNINFCGKLTTKGRWQLLADEIYKFKRSLAKFSDQEPEDYDKIKNAIAQRQPLADHEVAGEA